jgi:hypothetical protein
MFGWNSSKKPSNRTQNNGNVGYNGNGGYGGNGGSNGYGNSKMQKQSYMNKESQVQQTADMQMFKEQVDNTFISIEAAAKMSQNDKWGEDVVNAATDGAILTLDMFAVSCGEFIKRADKDAIDLAKKTVHDKWNKLKYTDPSTYELTTAYRDYLIAALNGNKNLRYKSYRVASSKLDIEAAQKLKNDPETLGKTYQYLIGNSQKYEHEQENNKTPQRNQSLKQQHQNELNEYRNSNKYKSSKSNKQEKEKYIRPNQSQFYFTQSGKNSKFSSSNHESDKKAMDEIVFGADNDNDEYSKLPKDLLVTNAIIKLSKKNPLGNITHPVPCKILYPTGNNKGKAFDKIRVRLAKPFDDKVLAFSVNMICWDKDTVKSLEQQWMQQKGDLGYKSMIEQEEEMNKMVIDNDDQWE